MTEKRFIMVKCIYGQWCIVDKTLKDDQIILLAKSKPNVKYIVDLLNELNEQKEYWKEKYKQELEKNSIITVAYDKQGNPHILTKKELEE